MRQYLPTFGELIDRLVITTLKSIKIAEHKEDYEIESNLIMNDIDEIIKDKNVIISGEMIRAIIVNAIANEIIWKNESEARQGGTNQDKLLKFTHSVNGVRNNAKNVISRLIGERKDLKLDCLAAELCKSHGYDFGGIFDA